MTTTVNLINGLLAEIDHHYQPAGKNKLAVRKTCSSDDMCAGCLKKVIHNLNCKVDYLHHRLYLAEKMKYQDLKVPDSLS